MGHAVGRRAPSWDTPSVGNRRLGLGNPLRGFFCGETVDSIHRPGRGRGGRVWGRAIGRGAPSWDTPSVGNRRLGMGNPLCGFSVGRRWIGSTAGWAPRAGAVVAVGVAVGWKPTAGDGKPATRVFCGEAVDCIHRPGRGRGGPTIPLRWGARWEIKPRGAELGAHKLAHGLGDGDAFLGFLRGGQVEIVGVANFHPIDGQRVRAQSVEGVKGRVELFSNA